MVLYYSGTGNSEYVARRIAKATDDVCINLFERIRNNDKGEICSENAFVIVCPTYGWRIPRVLGEWLSGVTLSGSRDIYFVMTCGGEIGNATKYLRRLCADKGMSFKGCAEIVMPENYIAMFDAPNEEKALEIINRSEPIIDEIAGFISTNFPIDDKRVGVVDRIKSSLVNAVYYPLCLHSDKFVVSNACNGCGKCERACVLNNIKITNGKPVWGDNCTHCMACICGCPAEAIEYGRASKGKPRYTCPK